MSDTLMTAADVLAVIERNRAALRLLSDHIWAHPELAYEEHDACAVVKAFLEARGFAVTLPAYGVDTAFAAEYGSGSPVFAICAEYDALPGIGHACGHNLICTSAIASFCALAGIIADQHLPGRVILLGTPAEEGGGGKIRMLRNGCLDGVDAVMMLHPSAKTTPDCGSTAVVGYTVEFSGKAAHAAGAPEKGVNALDAITLLFAAVNAYRQQMPTSQLIHGIITNGGQAPNIIPEKTECRFYLRSETLAGLEDLQKRFLDMVHGAELMTRATANVSIFHELYLDRKANAALNQAYTSNMEALGVKVTYPKKSGRGSSDFGNFSHVIPGAHCYFGIGSDENMPGHSTQFCAAAHEDGSFDTMLKAAAAMTQTVCRYLTDQAFRDAVQADFNADK